MTITLRAGVLNSGIQQNGTEFLTVDTSNNATLSNNLTVNGNTILGDATTDTLNVGNGGLVKDASGNVGIGLTNPVAKLQVYGNATIGQAVFLYNGTSVNYIDADTQIFRTGTATEQMRIDSAGLLKFNSGYGSAATAYGCRAWVNFNGIGTVAINSSGNVSSITDNGTGDYTANFTNTIVDTNYAMIATTCARGGFSSPTSNISIGVGSSVDGDAPSTYSTSAVRFYIQRSTGAGADLSNVSVAIFR